MNNRRRGALIGLAVGNKQLAVTWVAPTSTGGSAITDYVVKYSSNSGSAWTTFADPVSTATSVIVTGRINGTFYIFRVVAKNAYGHSLPSAWIGSLPFGLIPKPDAAAARRGEGAIAISRRKALPNLGSSLRTQLVDSQ